MHILQPKWRTALTRARQERKSGGTGKAIVLAVVGLLFWAAVFGVLLRVLRYFRGVQEIGALLAGKLLSLSLLSFVSVLLLSNVITALSSFFLAKDLDLLVSSPVDRVRIYVAKLGRDAPPFLVDGGADDGADLRRVRRRVQGRVALPARRRGHVPARSWCSRR